MLNDQDERILETYKVQPCMTDQVILQDAMLTMCGCNIDCHGRYMCFIVVYLVGLTKTDRRVSWVYPNSIGLFTQMSRFNF